VVEQKEWWFFKNFVDEDLKGKFIDLIFEGTSFQVNFGLTESVREN